MTKLKRNSTLHLIIVFLWLGLLVYLSFHKSLNLNLYGDDWLVISKFFGGYGPGKRLNYYDPRIWISNYGFQYLTSLLFLIFEFNSLPYYITSLILRTLLAGGIYFLVKRIYSLRVGVITASLFAILSVGAETTDWVYNLNTYLGIFMAISGLAFFITSERKRNTFLGWLLIITGYIVVPIRLLILPMLMPILVFIKVSIKEGRLSRGKKYMEIILKTLFAASPFLILKLFFPFLGWRPINSELLNKGIKIAQQMMSAGRYDFLLSPFTNLGQMILPFIPTVLEKLGWRIYPINNFFIYGFIIWAIGVCVLISLFRKLNKISVFVPIFISTLLLVSLKLFTRYQGGWYLKDFSYFFWTFLGIIFVIALFMTISIQFYYKEKNKLLFNLIVLFFSLTFVFPWLYRPGFLFGESHRYLITSGVGLALFFGVFLSTDDLKSDKVISYIKTALLLSLFGIHIFNSNRYFHDELKGRSQGLNDFIFTEIQKQIPKLPESGPSVFYFEDFLPNTYEALLRFGYGYHMQLLYDYPFNEKFHPVSANNLNDLEKLINKKDVKLEHIYGFRWEEGNLVNITEETRAKFK